MNKHTLDLKLISQYRQEIYGFSILWIMIFHSNAIYGLSFVGKRSFLYPLQVIVNNGRIGCEIFLFLSGICLYFSFFRKPDLMLFLKKRMEKLFFPLLIINGTYWAVLYLIKTWRVWRVVDSVFLTRFWLNGDQQIWFVSLIAVCYLFYPYVFYFCYGKEYSRTSFIIRCVLLVFAAVLFTFMLKNEYPEVYGRIEIAFTRIPCFLIGCFFGKAVYEGKRVSGVWIPVILFLDLFSFVIYYFDWLSGVYWRWYGTVFGIAMTFTAALLLDLLRCKAVNKALVFLGNMSLSLYLLHIMLGRVMREIIPREQITMVHYLLMLVLCMILGFFVERLIPVLKKVFSQINAK